MSPHLLLVQTCPVTEKEFIYDFFLDIDFPLNSYKRPQFTENSSKFRVCHLTSCQSNGRKLIPNPELTEDYRRKSEDFQSNDGHFWKAQGRMGELQKTRL